MRPNWESSLKPFDAQDDTSTNRTTWPGLLLVLMWSREKVSTAFTYDIILPGSWEYSFLGNIFVFTEGNGTVVGCFHKAWLSVYWDSCIHNKLTLQRSWISNMSFQWVHTSRLDHVSELSVQKTWTSHSGSKSGAHFTNFSIFTWKA